MRMAFKDKVFSSEDQVSLALMNLINIYHKRAIAYGNQIQEIEKDIRILESCIESIFGNIEATNEESYLRELDKVFDFDLLKDIPKVVINDA